MTALGFGRSVPKSVRSYDFPPLLYSAGWLRSEDEYGVVLGDA